MTAGGEGRDATRFGGAAADFIASLGRKAAELRAPLRALFEDSARERARDELRRKLHALGVGARLLHFTVLARAIASATKRIDEAATAGRIPDALLRDLELLVERIPELAWEKGNSLAPPPVQPPPSRAIAIAPIAAPWTVLVIGAEGLAVALEDDAATFPCELERTLDVPNALDLTRAVAPDLVVIDVELPGALELIASIADDLLAGTVPVVAIGERLGSGDKLARLLSLGVARTLEKPVTGVALREACADVVGERSRAMPSALHPEIGDVTTPELVARLHEELDRLLGAQLMPRSRDKRVALAMGAEVLGPFWGALERVRDVLREKSRGAIVFRDDHLRRSMAMTPAGAESTQSTESESTEKAERTTPRRRGPEIDLEGRVIVVADDDLAITTFIGDALAAAGADVLRTGDGESALSLARKHDASVIVSDVLMPKLDGVGLARAIRRDVALRDRPVVLLSWKEDLLQRLRDLRVGSSGTLKKDDDARTVVSRIREVLVNRVRVEARIAAGAEVRGRLDDLTVVSLLGIANRVRTEACVIVRDAAHVFEAELASGGLRRVSRTGVDGTFARGPEVLPGLLGVVGGRFLVRPLPGPVGDEALVGDLDEQLAPVLRRLRAACDAVSGVATIELAAVGLDPVMLASYLPSTPAPVKRVLEKLADGASPRTMILAGEVAPAVLEDVLVDAASRGLVVRAISVKGVDLLARAEARIDEVRSSSTPPPASVRDEASFAPTPVEFSLESLVPPAPPTPADPESVTPGSLADAVLRVSTGGPEASKPPMVDTTALKPRSKPEYSPTPTPIPASSRREGAPIPSRVATLHGVPKPDDDPDKRGSS